MSFWGNLSRALCSDDHKVMVALGVEPVNADGEPNADESGSYGRTCDKSLTVTVEAHAPRCGRQVQLVVGEIASVDRTPDPKLVGLLADAHRWFNDLSSGRRGSIAAIARGEGRNCAEVSRSVTLACLAPDIVELILTGRQPSTLTVERLRAARPLPADWSEQRRLLLD